MGLISQRVKRQNLKPGDHIYSWRSLYAYSHHAGITSLCPNFPQCGIRQPNGNGVIISCLDCFLKNGSLRLYDYGVYTITLLAKLKGGTCTTAESDPPETVIYRAMYLLLCGFGEFGLLRNNCEDFALYCKTGLINNDGVGSSGQTASTVEGPVAALIISPLGFYVPVVGVAASAGAYYWARYRRDIGVRTDVTMAPVENLPDKFRSKGRREKGLAGQTLQIQGDAIGIMVCDMFCRAET